MRLLLCGDAALGGNLREVAPFVAEPGRTASPKFGYSAACSFCGVRGPFVEVQHPFKNQRGLAQVEIRGRSERSRSMTQIGHKQPSRVEAMPPDRSFKGTEK